MKYVKKYLTNVLSLPTEYIIDRNKISLYFIDSNENYTMLYKQENNDSEIYKIIKRKRKYNPLNKDYNIGFETENCSEETFNTFQKVIKGNKIEKNRVVLNIDGTVMYVDDYVDKNLTIANIIFENKSDLNNFVELDFLEKEINKDDEYNDIDLRLASENL